MGARRVIPKVSIIAVTFITTAGTDSGATRVFMQIITKIVKMISIVIRTIVAAQNRTPGALFRWSFLLLFPFGSLVLKPNLVKQNKRKKNEKKYWQKINKQKSGNKEVINQRKCQD